MSVLFKKGLLGNNDFTNYQAIPPLEKEDWRKEPYTLNLQDVSYDIKETIGRWYQGLCFRKKRQKRVLNAITTQFKSGEITAILGSSGSGKTSLLDVISNRTEGTVQGKITLNDFECTRDFIKQTTAYVIQADRLLPTLTVRECLSYAAFLRLPAKTTKKERAHKVDSVIQKMGLKPVANSKIGGTIDRGISGGEKRRVTIAIQLLQDPSIILLDEPTTGLDSYTARHLISSLAELAHKGKLVILTIHQPRSDIFRLLDQVMIISKGETVYAGSCARLVPYFSEMGFPCPAYANPLDHYVDVTSIDRRTILREQQTSYQVEQLVQGYKQSDDFANIKQSVLSQTEKSHQNYRRMQLKTESRPNALRVLFMLISRMMRHTGRDRTVYTSRIFLLVMFVPFIVLFLMRMKLDQQSVQNRVGLIYQAMSVPSYLGIMNGFYLFPPLRELFYRETMDGLYSSPTFVLSYALYILPFHLFGAILFSLATYWITGMYDNWEYFAMFYGVLTVLAFVYEIMTIGTQGAILDPRIALNTVTIMLTFAVVLSSGLIRRMDDMLSFLRWFAYAWIYKYCTEILIGNEFKHLTFECSPNETCVYPTGQDFLKDYFPEAEGNMIRNGGVLVGFAGGFILVIIVIYGLRGMRNLH